MLNLLKAGTIVAICLLVVVAYRLSSPPREISIAAGGKGGGYYAIASRYASALARRGVRASIIQTAGAKQNLDLLSEGKVDAALVQGGLALGKEVPTVESVGRHFYEPLFIFAAAHLGQVDGFKQLLGRRIAIGGDGTGTQVLTRTLLSANGITASNAVLLTFAPQEAKEALLRGEIDAAMLVMSFDAPIVQELVRNEAVKIVSLKRAQAYERQFKYLTHLTLPEGAIDLPANIPNSRIDLLASTASVLVRKDLHPALVYVLTEVVSVVHGGRHFLGELGQEIRESDPEYQISDAAQRFYKHGAPFLHRYFSFWVADFLERALLIGLPAIAVLFPLVGGVAQLYRWHWHRKIQTWSRALLSLQAIADSQATQDQLFSVGESANRLVENMRSTRVPAYHSDEVLRLIQLAYEIKGMIVNLDARAKTRPRSN